MRFDVDCNRKGELLGGMVLVDKPFLVSRTHTMGADAEVDEVAVEASGMGV